MADRETQRILFGKTGKVENVDPESLDIQEEAMKSLDDLEKNDQREEYLGKMAEIEQGARVLKLDDALDLAIHHNRGYLSQKETLYLQALDLTLTRHELAPIFYGNLDVGTQSDAREGDQPPEKIEVQTEQDVIDPLTGDPVLDPETGKVKTEIVTEIIEKKVDGLIATNTFTRHQSVGFTMLQRTGARLAADFTSDFLSFVAGDRSINHSALAVTLTQPLLKGGGFKVTLENLTQADRDLLYAMRDFANFRRDFIVGIVARYYNVLQARDTVRNNYVAYDGFRKIVAREEALAEEDRRTQTELGQLRQAMLQAESQWVNAVRDYENQLDEMKIELGLPLDDKFILEEDEISRLKIEDPDIKRDQAVKVAMVARPDLQTVTDRIDDAERRIKVAKVELQAGLDAVARYDAISDPGDITPNINFERKNWSAGLELDLPLDRKAERNFYRSTLIELEQAKRQETLAHDQVRLQVYDDWRALEQARRNYEISQSGVELAQRRLEEQQLLNELGQGDARDLIDAQRDLVNSLNQRTSTLVDHTLARLRLWQDMGVLYINGDGSWEKKLEAEGQADE
ncbi:MAG: TolC family protein [Verrucomicrobiae bacterium]|nr:TolC family protein [Verrucomicrobiae bacterium]